MTEITIASIYPITVGIHRPQFIPQGSSDLWIPGVPENDASAVRERISKPALCVITDNHESFFAPVTHQMQQRIITADEIARDFIEHATTNSPGMGPGCHPGVWRCAGPTPTAAEIVAAQAVQAPFLQYLYDKGSEWASDPASRRAIVWRNRMASIALGREPDWLRPATGADIKVCPFCSTTLPMATVVCKECHNVVDVVKYAELKKRETDALKKSIQAA